jgi:hypothetical protein
VLIGGDDLTVISGERSQALQLEEGQGGEEGSANERGITQSGTHRGRRQRR